MVITSKTYLICKDFMRLKARDSTPIFNLENRKTGCRLMIENRHLRYFSVLARTLHMTRAAEQLHIAQPALTQNIQQLEEELGTLLIHRNGRKLSLTAAGRVFLFEAERSLRRFEGAKFAAQRAGRGELGRVAIGFGTAADVLVVPQLVKNFADRYPGVAIQLKEMGCNDQLVALRSGEIDIAISYTAPGQEFDSRELASEALIVAIHDQHILAKQPFIAIKDLAPDRLILPSRNVAATLAEAIMLEFAEEGVTPRSIQEVATWQTAIGLVAAGVGVSIMPESVRAYTRENVVTRSIKNARGRVRLVLSCQRDNISSAAQHLIAAI
jgi:DNA-binding transcriptional LysR family regulator